MASFNRKMNISGDFRVIGKAFKPQSEKTIDGVRNLSPDRFELYVLYCDSEKDGLYTDKPFVGTAKVTIKDYVAIKGVKTLKGKGSVFGDLLTVTELEGMTVESKGIDKDERLAQLMEEAGLEEKKTAGKTAKESK